jgi:hypothetical protein
MIPEVWKAAWRSYNAKARALTVLLFFAVGLGVGGSEEQQNALADSLPSLRGRSREVQGIGENTRGGPTRYLPLVFWASADVGRLVTSDPLNESEPSVSPDGSLVAFVSDRDGQWDVFLRPVAGERPSI